MLTDGGGHVGFHVARSLSEKGLRVCVCDNASNPASERTRSLATVFRVPPTRDEMNFIKAVQAIAQDNGVRMLIPVFFPEVVARHRDAFPGLLIPVDSEEKLLMLDNKASACNLAERNGILQPARYSSIEEIPDVACGQLVFKRCGGHGGDSVYFPKDRRTLEHLVDGAPKGSWLITDEIDGTDVSVDALRWGSGKDAFFVAGAYKVVLPRAKGISVLRESINAPELVADAKKMLDSIDFHGTCGFDFRIDPDGKAWFLECNPRFSGGIASQIASGIDMPWLLWKLAADGQISTEIARQIMSGFKAGVFTGSRSGMIDCLKRMKRIGNLTPRDLLYLLHPLSLKDS